MNWLQLMSYQRFGKKELTSNKNLIRSVFEQDFDRIIFSHPFRRLQDKTQVFPLPEHDFVHTRLTHSLEVSSVGRTLGKKVGEIIIKKYPELSEHHFSQFDFGAIVAAASLAHDLGNPPFGHAGEDAISDFFKSNPRGLFFKDKVNDKQWADFTNFEGNAQGFRILNSGRALKLTMASLAAFTKYPREAHFSDIDPNRKSQKKYGFFQSEKDVFIKLADEVGLKNLSFNNEMAWTRHPLAFLVEAADDICYSIIDLEDGCRLGLVSYEETKQLLASILGKMFDEEKLEKITSTEEKISLLRAMSINMLIDQCTEVFIENERAILSGQFDAALTDLIESKTILKDISKLSIEKIYRSRIVLETETAGYEVIDGLLESFTSAVFAYTIDKNRCTSREKSLVRLLPSEVKHQLSIEKDPYMLIMNVIDFVSSMTDTHAISLYRKIKGISLPSGFSVKY
ncbi:deoxyguanosinetriphosphate triphosphohydrolase [Fulvivirgaceae bacterium BMA10]|uniref:Deoxyguanosinetriphosphate triphosphohydrolase n=1 Tax=Splendidivirga corallicola TaxID=3051826 RepID=A0ABT8KMP3_9BACT|nr:deoxyguanosinetriphosphate triphosphohydrolase [Fulvivirgaceae bacterium BMA10]